MGMDYEKLRAILGRGERQALDWKADFPGELRGGAGSRAWEKGRGILLKDLVAMANGLSDGVGHLVYGVKDHGSHRQVLGRHGSWDDADFQTWAQNTFTPPPEFSYVEVQWRDGLNVGLFEIRVSAQYPHVVKQSLGEVLHQGQVWTRHEDGCLRRSASHASPTGPMMSP